MTKKNKSELSVLLGAAFLMATSAIGPGFLTQTATFTEQFQANFGFAIFICIVMALIVQLNVWRVIGITGLRAQDIANKVFPGLGYLIAFLVEVDHGILIQFQVAVLCPWILSTSQHIALNLIFVQGRSTDNS